MSGDKGVSSSKNPSICLTYLFHRVSVQKKVGKEKLTFSYYYEWMSYIFMQEKCKYCNV